MEGGIKPALPLGDGAFLPAGTVVPHLSGACFREDECGPLVCPHRGPAVWDPVSRDQASSPPPPCLVRLSPLQSLLDTVPPGLLILP